MTQQSCRTPRIQLPKRASGETSRTAYDSDPSINKRPTCTEFTEVRQPSRKEYEHFRNGLQHFFDNLEITFLTRNLASHLTVNKQLILRPRGLVATLHFSLDKATSGCYTSPPQVLSFDFGSE